MFAVGRKELLDACALASKSVKSGNTTMPVLQAFRLESGVCEAGGYLEVTGNDLQTSTAVNIRGGVVVPGDQAELGPRDAACVKADVLVRLLRESADDEVEARYNKDRTLLRVSCGRCRMDLATFDPASFPEMPVSTDGAATWTFPRADLLAALDRAYVAAADEELTRKDMGRLAVQAVLFAGETFVGCDNYRVCVQKVAAAKTGEGKPALVHHRDVAAMANLLKSSGEPFADLIVDPNQVTLAVGRNRITCRVLAGMYPPWERAIPKNLPWETRFNVADLRRVISQGSLACDAEAISAEFAFADGTLTVRSASANKGYAEASAGGEIPPAMKLVIRLQPSSVQEMLRTLPDKDSVSLRFGGPLDKVAMAVPNGTYYVTPMHKKDPAT